MKKCSKCGVEKPLDCFSNDKSKKAGKRFACRGCEALVNARRYKERYKSDPEFRARVIKRAQLQQQTKPELHRENARRWYHADIERGRAKSRRGQQNYRKRKQNGEGTYTNQEWEQVCEDAENRCLACGQEVSLTADHIVPLSKGGSNYITNIQPLCLSCNSKKHDKTIDYRRKNQ